jgi:curved DNA-binding protein CbpA
MHRLYISQPAHDTALYDVLRVSPNATLAQITKSYRKLSRDLHPDKVKLRNRNLSREEAQEQLERVREAYDVLKDDSTRLPYHRYGLQDSSEAAFILTGGKMGTATTPSPEQERLLRLMGYVYLSTATGRMFLRQRHEERVLFLAANLIERIRPLVEGAVSESVLADSVARECDELKKLPLGAQILRCIGRAYRHSGQRVLRKHQRRKHPLAKTGDLGDKMKDKMRDAKQLLTAATASGRFILTEQLAKARIQKDYKMSSSSVPQIEYQELGELCMDNGDANDRLDETIKQQEHIKAQNAILESLQIEALWKITKIDLDRTIQEACTLILSGEYFFFPSHTSPRPVDWNRGADGWVGSTGKAIDTDVGRLRAASALVLIGNVMVMRSKEGTAWME